MIPLIPGLIYLRARLDDPLADLRVLLQSAPALTARVTSGPYTGTLEVDRSGAVRVVTDPKTGASQRVVHGPEGDWEFDDAERLYDFAPREAPVESSPPGTGRLAEAARALLVPGLLPLGPKNPLKSAKLRRQGSSYVSEDGSYTLVFGEDAGAKGKLVRVRLATMDGTQEWGVSGLKETRLDPVIFRPPLAPGYVEAFEPRLPDAARAGTPLPSRLAALAPKGGGSWLLAFVGANEDARTWLKGTGLPVAFADATDEERRALKIVALPTYHVVGPDGKVRGVWLGYAPSMEAELLAEWRKALTPGK